VGEEVQVLHVTLSLVYFQVLSARIPDFITFSAFLLIKTKNQHVDHLIFTIAGCIIPEG
jgi:hypothetical protein